MAETTRLCDLQQQVQALQLQLQTTAAARTQRLLDFKTEIISLFEKFQDRILHQLQSSSSSQAGLLGPPPQSPPPTPSLQQATASPTPSLQQATASPTPSPILTSILDPHPPISQTQLPPPEVDSYCHYFHISTEDRLVLAAMHVDHSAAPWFQGVSRDAALLEWNTFTTALVRRFGPTEFEDPAGSLMKLHQPSSVLEYQAACATLSSRVSGLSSSLLKSTFLSGLKLLIRRAVIPQRPHDPGGGLDIRLQQP